MKYTVTSVLFGLAVTAMPVAAAAGSGCQSAPVAEQKAAARAISDMRQSAGLPALRPNPILSATAAAHACAMAASGRMVHSGQGQGPGGALRKAGYRWSVVSENVAVGPWDLGKVLGAWRSSPRHLSNMMLPQARDMGIAVAMGPDGRSRYWAAVFAAQQ